MISLSFWPETTLPAPNIKSKKQYSVRRCSDDNTSISDWTFVFQLWSMCRGLTGLRDSLSHHLYKLLCCSWSWSVFIHCFFRAGWFVWNTIVEVFVLHCQYKTIRTCLVTLSRRRKHNDTKHRNHWKATHGHHCLETIDGQSPALYLLLASISKRAFTVCFLQHVMKPRRHKLQEQNGPSIAVYDLSLIHIWRCRRRG